MAASTTETHPAANLMDTVLEAKGLVREYGSVVAVTGVDLSLRQGDFLTIFGPNGAGKSSLLGMLGGGLRPTHGSVSICGEPVDFSEVDWRYRVGVLSHKGFLYEQLTAKENLQFYGQLFGLAELDARIARGLDQVGLTDRAGSRVGELSHGMRHRLSLARTLLHDPDVVLLDEPFTGLDPSATAVLRDVLQQLKDGSRTVVMVTHNLSEGLELATHITIQVSGRLAWQGVAAEVDRVGFGRFYHDVVEGQA